MKHAKELTTLGTWSVEFADQVRRFDHQSEVFPYLSQLVHGRPAGRVVVDEDVGARSWISRFLFGLHPRLLLLHLALEWNAQVAALIFLDDAASEYRAKDTENPVHADEAIRKTIAHGEPTPHPPEQCIRLDRALQAIQEYLKTGIRPVWLQYDFVP